jgi:hypothetical protein
LSDGGREATSPGQYRGDVRFRAPSALAIATLAGSLFLSACNDVNPPAATVNGTEISKVDFLDRLESFQAQGDAFARTPIFEGVPVNTSITDGIGADFARRLLSLEVQTTLILEKAKADGLNLVDGDWAEADRNAAGFFGEATDLLRPEDQEYYRSVFRAVEAIGRNEAKGQAPDAVEVMCLSHILVEDRALADELKTQLDDGADFAELAAANSIDTGSGANGGSLDNPDGGCNSVEFVATSYVPEFAEAALAAPVNEVTDPVESQSGFHLIKVTDRKVAGPDDPSVQAQIAQIESDAFGEWYGPALAEAKVEVDPRFGVWDGPTQSVVPNPPTLANQEDLVDLDGLTVTDGSNG